MNTGNQEVLQIALADIIPNQFQPRVNFDEQELQELAQSIKEHGIIQPLVLRKMNGKYEIIAGERRYRAAGMAGLTTVPAIISNIDDHTSAEVALVENVQRKDLTAIEEARSYKNILDKGYLTQEQLAKKMGVSQPQIANKLRLLSLDESVQQALLNNQISERHARSLLALENKEEQKKWLNRIINDRLTVRQLDVEIKKEQGGINPENISSSPIQSIEDIKNNATDIPLPGSSTSTQSGNTFFNFDNQTPRPPVDNSNADKPQNKFFNFLEDESANMNTTVDNGPDIFNNTPLFNTAPTNPLPSSNNGTENKFINLDNNPPIEPDKPVIDLTPKDSSPAQADEPKLETLFDPMDQVDQLDPNYEKKLQEEAGLDLTSGINEVRDNIQNMKDKGFKIETEELDLDNEYQIIIKIEK